LLPPVQTKYSVSPLNVIIGVYEIGIEGNVISVLTIGADIEDTDFVDIVEWIDDADGVRLRDCFVNVDEFVEVVDIVGGNPCNCDCDISDPGLCADHCVNF